MKIRMLKTERGSPDGIRLELFSAGQVYDLTGTDRERDLARVFVRHGWAEEFKEKPAHENAATAPAENKTQPIPRRK